jgi:hypothetical protein
MTALAHRPSSGGVDPLLTGDLLAHLDLQIVSAARMLELVLAQSAAIRRRDVDTVVRHVAELQAEMERRNRLEEQRARLLQRAAATLGIPAHAVTLAKIAAEMAPADAAVATRRSAELNGLLREIQREHTCNQVLMRQELAFLDHLLRLIDPEPSLGYVAGGARRDASASARPGRRTLDLQA